MLRLASSTPVEWVERMEANLSDFLLDHAHCEKKAASTALSLIFRYPEFTCLIRPLTEVAREELEHFELLLDLIERRGERFRRLSPSPYAGRLLSKLRPANLEKLVDTLLCCALIEARSCERMSLLSQHLADDELRAFYGQLLESEARHFTLYVGLARAVAPEADITSRLNELAKWEAEVILSAPSVPRMHN
ncbi:MAG: tRNA-(ms[2]io[6]A)-hydroxylase [Bradymonadia bacterium]